DAVIIIWKPLGFHQALSSAGRATVPIRKLGAFAVERCDERFGAQSHFVLGPIRVIHVLFPTFGKASARTRVTSIGRTGCITPLERLSQFCIADRACPSTIATAHEFSF